MHPPGPFGSVLGKESGPCPSTLMNTRTASRCRPAGELWASAARSHTDYAAALAGATRFTREQRAMAIWCQPDDLPVPRVRPRQV
jgi:hypothetical protein